MLDFSSRYFRPINRRKPNWNTVLQPENDLFEPEIQPNLPENAKFWHFSRLKNPKKHKYSLYYTL